MSNSDDVHMLQCLLTASWHKLYGASWRPVTHSDLGRLHLASTQERVTAAREGLQRCGDMTKASAWDAGAEYMCLMRAHQEQKLSW